MSSVVNPPSPSVANRPRLLFFVHFALWLAADIVTKQLAITHLRHRAPVPLVPGFLDFAYAENTGVAFSLLASHPELLIFITIALFAYLAYTARNLDWSRSLIQITCGMVAAGAIGNLLDRVIRGSVVDFISVHWHEHYWPTFNIADTGICVGLGLLLLCGGLHPPGGPTPPAGT